MSSIFVRKLPNGHFLFIGGLHRSGTSILHRLLSDHPDVSGFEGTGASQDEGQHLQTVYKSARYYGGPGRFGFHPKARLTERSALITNWNRYRLLNEWAQHYKIPAEVYVEKSPPNIIRSRFLQALFPKAKFIFVVRHPIAVSYATLKWKKALAKLSNKPFTLGNLFLHWNVVHSILLEDLSFIRNALLVRYEDLVNEPDRYLTLMQEFAGLSPCPIARPVRNSNTAYYEMWENRTECFSEVKATLVGNRNVMGSFGYELAAPYVSDSGSVFETDTICRVRDAD